MFLRVNPSYLVGGIPTPLKNMTSSVGMIKKNNWVGFFIIQHHNPAMFPAMFQSPPTSYDTGPPFFWANYNHSLPWIVRPWLGMIPRILTMISRVRENSELVMKFTQINPSALYMVGTSNESDPENPIDHSIYIYINKNIWKKNLPDYYSQYMLWYRTTILVA